MQRLNYFRRIFKVYLTKEKGYLSFWHECSDVSSGIAPNSLEGPYYMTFKDKARYAGPKDENGVILFDYYFDIGRQYNPLAVAQYGLGHWNLYLETKDEKYFRVAQTQADWLVEHLEKEDEDLWVWKHHFKWHYKHELEAGWYSAHSQGTGISLLGRMFTKTRDEKYKQAAERAFQALDKELDQGGVKYTDPSGGVWLEEYRVSPPTHILNGYLWALWGVWDLYLLSQNPRAKDLFWKCVKTLKNQIGLYDAGFWSLYDLSKQKMKMIASPFYHKLHIVQLRVMHRLTGEDFFADYMDKFASYEKSFIKRTFALVYKAIFKLFYF